MSKNNNDQFFNFDEIEQLSKDFESAMENGNSQQKFLPTRASIKRDFMGDLTPGNFMKLKKAMEKLEDQFGITNTSDMGYPFQEKIDTLVEELLTVRELNDILDSREDTLKTYVKDIISNYQIEPDRTPGELVSPKHKIKICKEVRGGKLNVDIDLLKKKLTPEQFKSVTNVVTTTVETTSPDGKMDEIITTSYTVNNKFLEQEMVKGNILSEDIFLSSVESKRVTAVYIRELEN